MANFSEKMPTAEGMVNILNFLYDKAIGDVPVLGSAIDLANSYRGKTESPHHKVNSLIRWQCTKTISSGFLLGLPGGPAMRATIPADISQTLFIQLRMVAAIEHLYEYDVYSDQARSLAFVCLCGSKAMEVVKQAGIKVGEKMAKNLLQKIPEKVLIEINKKVGMRLLTKTAQQVL